MGEYVSPLRRVLEARLEAINMPFERRGTLYDLLPKPRKRKPRTPDEQVVADLFAGKVPADEPKDSPLRMFANLMSLANSPMANNTPDFAYTIAARHGFSLCYELRIPIDYHVDLVEAYQETGDVDLDCLEDMSRIEPNEQVVVIGPKRKKIEEHIRFFVQHDGEISYGMLDDCSICMWQFDGLDGAPADARNFHTLADKLQSFFRNISERKHQYELRDAEKA